jgi:molybdate transport system ATP-binding protein
MNDITIKYGEKTILSHINWTVRKGDCWALCGQNGSGKSTLLSLICADNPQAYACDISLFGRKRGSGESIWEIKRHIGYVSPEMHRSYHHNIPVIQVMASGLKDTVGLYTRTNEAEREKCRWWMRIFGIEHLETRPFLSLSSGEQRLVLVARAFVKDPQLLILDEPLHGLDNQKRALVKDIIETYSEKPNKTLIMVTHYEEDLPKCFTLKKQLIKQ